ncbi:MAG: biotin/lipoyl-containing protein, partial [Luteolibacter sp.]
MAIEIKVPAAGESITSANIATWYKKDGDAVKKGDTLVSLETDKVSNELEAEADGILKIIVAQGEEVAIGTVIGSLEEGGEAAPSPESESPSSESVDLKVPAAGESITSANVAEWKKNHGDHVEKGEILVSLETDKVSNELEAP